MKKLTDFIVDKRIFVFSLFVLITIISFIASNKVVINRDITNYLPSSSETRIGMDIMDKEFSKTDSSTLNIMFKGLSKKEKENIYKELSSYKEVEEVEYDDTKKYNKDGYTLYILTVNADKESTTAQSLYDKVTKNFKDYTYETSGDVSDEYRVALPVWIVFLAIACALVILIIMCNSYIEPFLFLIAIGMGVFINKGTNIIFPSISSITNSIAAILQLALSMDYSIMLMNRYRQEKEHEKNNVKAMKEALYKSFSSISSSSVTTIVGLIALVFMSFTIGADLGLVLAKGVLFSLVTIFTCLPFLILTFDKLITKTEKKAKEFKMNWLGKLSYNCRYLGVIIFIIIAVGSIILKGNLGILFTDSDTDEVRKKFNTNNQMALIYKNKYENKIASYCKKLEEDNKMDEVLCYGNTINESLSYTNLNERLKSLGSEDDIEEYLLRIVYYKYNTNESNKMSYKEFINFIKSDVYSNEKLNSHINNTTRVNIDKLNNFIDDNLKNEEKTKEEIANLFEIDPNTVNDLFIYYNSLNNSNSLSMSEFISFMNNYVLSSKYASSVDNKMKSDLKIVTPFTDIANLNKEYTSTEMASLFNKDKETIDNLYLFYTMNSNLTNKLTINEFTTFVINNVLPDSRYNSSLDLSTINKLYLLNNFSNKEQISRSMTYQEISNFFNIDTNLSSQIFLLKYLQTDNGTQLTIKEFVDGVNYLKNNTHYLDDVDVSRLNTIPEFLLQSEAKFTSTQLANLFGLDKEDVNKLYALISYINGDTSSWQMTPYEFVTFILNNKESEKISSSLTEELLSNLNTLFYTMNSTLNDITFTYEELSTALGLSQDSIKNIYALYVFNNTTIKMQPSTFINLILNNKNNLLISERLDQSTINDLVKIKNIIDKVYENKKYTQEELSKILNIDSNKISLIYSLYEVNYKSKNIQMSYKEFINFLIKNVIPNEEYKNYFDTTKINKITTIDNIMNNNLKKYSKEELYKTVSYLSDDVDKDLVDLLYIYYGSIKEFNNNWTLTVEEFINYLNNVILKDSRFDDFIDEDLKEEIVSAKSKISDAKKLLVGSNYSRVVLNTRYALEDEESFNFLTKLLKELNLKEGKDIYLVGNTPMAYEMDKTFGKELDFITLLTIAFIFIIVAITFKSLIIPTILVLLIQTAVYITMGILSFESSSIYFIAILIVQSILMGATIDYAILFTSYYLEFRKKYNIKGSLINAYNNSIHTILTSASILTLVTLVVGHFGSATTSRICITISQGTVCSTILIIFILPALIAAFDKFVVKK